MAEAKYKRLTRERGAARFGIASVTRSSLWLGEDHLLLVECTGYSETYKRFFFRDIQAFTLRMTKRRMAWNWVWATLLFFSLLTIWAASDDWRSTGTTIATGIVVAIFGIPLWLNNQFGPSCACEIRTAVQTEELPSLCRIPKTQKVMDRVRPLIIAAQGQLTGDEIATRMRATTPTPTTSIDPFGGLPPVTS